VNIRRVAIVDEGVGPSLPVRPWLDPLAVYAGALPEDDGLQFEAGASSAYTDVVVPQRPLTLRLGPFREARAVALTLRWSLRWKPQERQLHLGPPEIRAGETLSRTLNVPADVRDLQLELASVDGEPLPVGLLQLDDGCTIRDYEPVATMRKGFQVHENRRALPRIYSATRLHPVESVERARLAMREAPRFKPGVDATVQTSAPLPADLRKARIGDVRFEPRRLKAQVDSPDGEAFIVVNDRFDPNWRATVDGAEVPIVRTNGVVRGVRIPPGVHTLRMWYEPPASLTLGAILAALGLLLALLVVPRLDRRLRRRHA